MDEKHPELWQNYIS